MFVCVRGAGNPQSRVCLCQQSSPGVCAGSCFVKVKRQFKISSLVVGLKELFQSAVLMPAHARCLEAIKTVLPSYCF